MIQIKKNIFIILTFCRLTLCRTFDPLSFDPVSFVPLSFDPGSFDPLLVNQLKGLAFSLSLFHFSFTVPLTINQPPKLVTIGLITLIYLYLGSSAMHQL